MPLYRDLGLGRLWRERRGICGDLTVGERPEGFHSVNERVVMSFQHHSEGMSPEFRKLFEDQQASRQRFQEQVDGRARRSFSEGRIGPTDDGDLAFSVGTHPDKPLVCIDFGKPVEWVAMGPQQAIELAQSLIKQARSVSTEPLRIVLH